MGQVFLGRLLLPTRYVAPLDLLGAAEKIFLHKKHVDCFDLTLLFLAHLTFHRESQVVSPLGHVLLHKFTGPFKRNGRR